MTSPHLRRARGERGAGVGVGVGAGCVQMNSSGGKGRHREESKAHVVISVSIYPHLLSPSPPSSSLYFSSTLSSFGNLRQGSQVMGVTQKLIAACLSLPCFSPHDNLLPHNLRRHTIVDVCAYSPHCPHCQPYTQQRIPGVQHAPENKPTAGPELAELEQ